jgi:NAD-dependent SIR2 family protein deacetylase
MAGHVFVVRGDLTEISCDDWLLPSGSNAHVTHGWWRPWLMDHLRGTGAWCARFTPGVLDPAPMLDDIKPLVGWDHKQGPKPWLMNIRGRQHRIERVRRCLRVLAEQPADARHLSNRGQRLVALPVIGTGHGGSRHEAGKILKHLLPVLHEEARRLQIDIALVTRSSGDFTAGQQARISLGEEAFSELPNPLYKEAERLARLAAAGQLVMFLGAGVSAGAGLPEWKTLLAQLAEEIGFQSEELEAFHQLDALDQAEYLAQKCGGHGEMGKRVAEHLRSYRYYSLSHGLLASTPFTEAVTTNYDQLFEKACHAAHRPLAVLPYAPAQHNGQWLLKMHGCLDYPDDIVLTRQSYLRYTERNAALSGIVQAMLITKHMMFTGFSLNDDNFLRIVDQVRRAVHPHEKRDHHGMLGSALMLYPSPLYQTLWQRELQWVCMNQQDESLAFTDATRRFEMFLDCVAHCASAQSHLLDKRFRGVLNEHDLALKHLLMPLLKADESARSAGAWQHVAELLRQLGGKV